MRKDSEHLVLIINYKVFMQVMLEVVHNIEVITLYLNNSRAFKRFWQAKLGYSGLVLGMSHFNSVPGVS